jgi:hypothetical protein
MNAEAEKFASSMIKIYGRDAEPMARQYADKHKRSRDMKRHTLWLSVAEIIQARMKNTNAKKP